MKKNTLKNIEAWGKLYKDGVVDGDVIMLTEDRFMYKAGNVGIVEIRWDRSTKSPRRAVWFKEHFGICGIHHFKYVKLT